MSQNCRLQLSGEEMVLERKRREGELALLPFNSYALLARDLSCNSLNIRQSTSRSDTLLITKEGATSTLESETA